MDDQATLVQRVRDLGAFGCAIRIIGAVPLLLVVAMAAAISSDAFPFLMWWEWVTFRPLVLRSRRYQAETMRNHSQVALRARGRALTPLKPTGKVSVDSTVCEARSDGGWIDQDTDIVVIGSDTFGLIVRAQLGGEPGGARRVSTDQGV